MKFPKWYHDITTDLSYFKDSCKLTSADLNPGATCEVLPDGQEDVLTIKNALNSFRGGNPVSFILDGIRNAPTTRGTPKISLFAKTLDGL
jgi:hypothetical protein